MWTLIYHAVTKEMLLQTGQQKALCTLPAIPNVEWGLGRELKQETPKNGDCKLIPNKWETAH